MQIKITFSLLSPFGKQRGGGKEEREEMRKRHRENPALAWISKTGTHSNVGVNWGNFFL